MGGDPGGTGDAHLGGHPPGVLNAIFSLKCSASHPLIKIASYISYGMKSRTSSRLKPNKNII